MQIQTLLLFIFVGLTTTNEHWFIFDQYQFPGFSTPLFTLISSINPQEQKYFSFILSTYERSVLLDITLRYLNGTIKQHEQSIKLNIERANLMYNTLDQMIFVTIRDQTKFESYVNCKLIDSYLLYSSTPIDENLTLKVKNISENIDYYEITPTNEHTQQEIFDTFSCKIIPSDNKSTSIIERPFIRKMQHVIEKIQRSRREKSSPALPSDSLTIIYKPNIDKSTPGSILNIPELNFQIQYYPNEHLFHIRFNNATRTQFLLYADKSFDTLSTNLTIFLHITSTMITCFVNCELTDQDFIIDSFYIENIFRKLINNNPYDYNRQSTLVLFNKSIEQIATNLFCLKLDKKHEELLPEKYTLRKFTNALDMLVNSLDRPITNDKIILATTTTDSISVVNIPFINGFGSLKAPPLNSDINIETSSISTNIIEYDKLCSTDEDCGTIKSSMKCQLGHCSCPKRLFWSSVLHRCLVCHDLLIGNRCFRLSNHKSTWYEANNYCQDDNSINEDQEYTMKLTSNLNRTDIQYLKQSFLHNNDHEQMDYMYWIGATSHFDTRKLHQIKSKTKREMPTTIFRWYDNGEIARLNIQDMWCSQMDYTSLTTINNNQLCVSMTSCGLYADDCQRNYRFLCEAI